MSFKNKLFKKMFKMSSAATQKASKFLVHLLQWTQPNPTHKKLKNLDPIQPNPTHGSTQPMDNSVASSSAAAAVVYLERVLVGLFGLDISSGVETQQTQVGPDRRVDVVENVRFSQRVLGVTQLPQLTNIAILFSISGP